MSKGNGIQLGLLLVLRCLAAHETKRDKEKEREKLENGYLLSVAAAAAAEGTVGTVLEQFAAASAAAVARCEAG